jgi:DHA1 family tetracycline resistance protein-like MFS transporter
MKRSTQRVPLPQGFSAIWGCVALDLVGFGIVVPILPRYAEDFGASATTIGLLVASFSVAQLVFAPVLGAVSDRVGRKPVLVCSLVGTAVGSLLTGLAGSLWLLFLGRVIDGASGASVSVAQAAVADLAPPDQRARLLGLLGAAFGLGFVAGPAIGALAVLGGPHVPFLIAAALAGVNAVVALRRLPETKPQDDVQVAKLPRQEARHRDLNAGEGVRGLIIVSFLGLLAFSAFEATFALFVEGGSSWGSRRPTACSPSSAWPSWACRSAWCTRPSVGGGRRGPLPSGWPPMPWASPCWRPCTRGRRWCRRSLPSPSGRDW